MKKQESKLKNKSRKLKEKRSFVEIIQDYKKLIISTLLVVIVIMVFVIDFQDLFKSFIEALNNIFSPITEKEEEYEEINKTEVTSDPDIKAPELLSVKVNPQQINNSGTIQILLKAKDDKTGIKYVIVTVTGPPMDEGKRGKTSSVHLSYNENSDNWTGSFNIENYYKSGKWYIKNVYLTDVADNNSYYYVNEYYSTENYVLYNSETQSYIATDISFEEFNVKGTQPDLIPPRLESINIEPQSINISGKAIVKANFIEEDSGINYTSVQLYSPDKSTDEMNNGKSKSISLTYQPHLELWTGAITINKHYQSGIWTIYKIYAIDEAGNTIEYTYDKEADKENYMLRKNSKTSLHTDIPVQTLRISGTDPDIYPPKLKSISITPETLIGEGIVKLEVSAEDKGTGIKYISAYFYSPNKVSNNSKGVSLNVYMSHSSTTGVWENTLSLKTFHETGEWKLGYILIKDNAGNDAKYRLENNDSKKHKNYTIYSEKQNKYVISDIPVVGFIKK
jgi:hypothetical protein